MSIRAVTDRLTILYRWEAALPGVDLDSSRVDATLRLSRGARERLERVPAELDHRRVVDCDHVHRRLAGVL